VGWLLNSAYHSIVVLLCPLLVLWHDVPDSTGRTAGLWYNGVLIYTAVLLLVTLKLALEIRTWTIFHHIAVWGSLAVYAIFCVVWHVIALIPIGTLGVEVLFVIFHLLRSPLFYFTLLLVPLLALLRDFSWKFMFRSYLPQDYHIVQEVQMARAASPSRLHKGRPSLGYSYSQDTGTGATIARGVYGKKHI
jgi:phospholipid-transporting ATPase